MANALSISSPIDKRTLRSSNQQNTQWSFLSMATAKTISGRKTSICVKINGDMDLGSSSLDRGITKICDIQSKNELRYKETRIYWTRIILSQSWTKRGSFSRKRSIRKTSLSMTTLIDNQTSSMLTTVFTKSAWQLPSLTVGMRRTNLL